MTGDGQSIGVPTTRGDMTSDPGHGQRAVFNVCRMGDRRRQSMVERRDTDADARAGDAKLSHQRLVSHHQTATMDKTQRRKALSGRQIKIQTLSRWSEWR